jgi:hypothetical protein
MPAPDLTQLNSLVSSVASQLEAALGTLYKADGDDPDDAGSPPATSASAAPPSPADSPDPAASPDAPPSADPAAAAGGGDPAADAGQGVTVESLMSEYAALPLPMLQMHLQAAEAAFQQVAGAAGGDPAASAGGAPPPPPGAGAPPPPDASASPGGPPPGMGKSEIALPADIMGRIATLQKSVEQIGGLRKSLVDMNAKLVARDGELQATKSALAKAQSDMTKMTVDTNKVAEGVAKVLARTGTLRKSASRMSDIAVASKPGATADAAPASGITPETPRATVLAALNKFTSEGHPLAKSDQAALTKYVCNAQAPVQPVLEILAKFPSQ